MLSDPIGMIIIRCFSTSQKDFSDLLFMRSYFRVGGAGRRSRYLHFKVAELAEEFRPGLGNRRKSPRLPLRLEPEFFSGTKSQRRYVLQIVAMTINYKYFQLSNLSPKAEKLPLAGLACAELFIYRKGSNPPPGCGKMHLRTDTHFASCRKPPTVPMLGAAQNWFAFILVKPTLCPLNFISCPSQALESKRQ